MSRFTLRGWVGGLAFLCTVSAALACGTPPANNPPPPPPSPSIVCCVIVKWCRDPVDWRTHRRLLIRYFRQDGLPLFQSNPMPLLPSQACGCGLPPLPQAAVLQGATVAGMSFGGFTAGDVTCCGLPTNPPGYGPFVPLPPNDPQGITLQMGQFFQSYALAAGDLTSPDSGPAAAYVFQGPGTIPANSFFDVFVELKVPHNFDPTILCIPGQQWVLGLFLINGTQVLAEPQQTGQAPIPIAQFQINPGNSSFYKFKWYPYILRRPCCLADLNENSVKSVQDLFDYLAAYFAPCP